MTDFQMKLLAQSAVLGNLAYKFSAEIRATGSSELTAKIASDLQEAMINFGPELSDFLWRYKARSSDVAPVKPAA